MSTSDIARDITCRYIAGDARLLQPTNPRCGRDCARFLAALVPALAWHNVYVCARNRILGRRTAPFVHLSLFLTVSRMVVTPSS